MSQKAGRAVRSTPGGSCVLVGMRREEYVADVVEELRRPVEQTARVESWRALRKGLEGL